MLTLFIFKSNSRGMQYGIGTYIDQLTRGLLKWNDITIYLIKYHCYDIKELVIFEKTEKYTEIKIPAPMISVKQNNRFDNKYAISLIRILDPYIPKQGKVVFQFNYIDDISILRKIKEYFGFPSISVVHFAQWQQIFDGNIKKLKGLNFDNPTNNIEFTLSLEREFYRQADHIVSVTRYMKEFLISVYKIPPDKICIIKNGLDSEMQNSFSNGEISEIKLSLGFCKNDIIILFSGRVDPCKGIYFLIDAFELACKKNKDIRLVIIGQGELEECQKKVHSYFGRITYTGFLPKEMVDIFYKIADIGIAPSIYDHCPYSVLEMISNKIPIIMSEISGLDELLSEDQCLFVNPVVSSEGNVTFRPKDLSELILTLASDKELRTKLAHSAYLTFVNKFNSFIMADEMHRLLHTLTSTTK